MTGVHRGASQDVPLLLFFSWTPVVCEQRFGAVVPPHGPCARLHCLHLHKAALVLLSLRTLRAVVAVAVVKGAPKFRNYSVRKRAVASGTHRAWQKARVSYVLKYTYTSVIGGLQITCPSSA